MQSRYSCFMSTVINLRQARKTRTRAEKRAKGDANAVKFGEAKPLRDAREAEQARSDHLHEAHRRDDAPKRDD